MNHLATDEHEAALRSGIIAAVQAELTRHAETIVAENAKLRADALRERDDLHREYGGKIAELTETMTALAHQNAQLRREIGETVEAQMATRVEARLSELESRVGRRLEQLTHSIDELVKDAARPLLESLRDEQTAVNRRVEVLDGDLRKFDEQAARLVVHFNEMTAKIQQRAEETSGKLKDDVARQVADIEKRVTDVSEATLRQHSETSKMVGERADRLEERINVRVSAIEGSMREEVGNRIAEIDAHVGRVSQGLDDTLNVLGDRMAAMDAAVADVDQRITAIREEFGEMDGDSLDELKERLSAAAGESVLIRMDLEKLEKFATERLESANARLATVESTLADTTMDVSTAVQLERLEELERAVIEIDPSRFVLREDASGTVHDNDNDNDDERGAEGGAA